MKERMTKFFTHVAIVAIVIGQLLVGCAAPEKKVTIKRAREFAKTQRGDVGNYSAALADRGDHYFILFTRKGWPRKAGDYFGVSIDKQTSECTLQYGQ